MLLCSWSSDAVKASNGTLACGCIKAMHNQLPELLNTRLMFFNIGRVMCVCLYGNDLLSVCPFVRPALCLSVRLFVYIALLAIQTIQPTIPPPDVRPSLAVCPIFSFFTFLKFYLKCLNVLKVFFVHIVVFSLLP